MKHVAYLFQAVLVAIWWIGLGMSEDFFDFFQFPGIDEAAFNSFLLPDILLIVGLSLYRGYVEKRAIELIILGAFAYGTLYCINATILTEGGYISTFVMLLGLAYNFFLVTNAKLFQTSTSDSNLINGLKTSVQVVCVWTIFLVVIPAFLMQSFDESMDLQFSPLLLIGVSLFVLGSSLGLYSAFTMVRQGKGTPLPIDQTQALVVSGPYKIVRNPMAVAGVVQGIAVSLMFSSLSVFLYFILGAVAWHLAVKPLEEKDMEERFGDAYLAYKSQVNCWIPKLGFRTDSKG